MALANGSQILARTLRRLHVDTFFYIMGGPMMAAETASVEEGLRAIDVRTLSEAAESPYGSTGLGSKYQGQRGPTPSRYWKNFVEDGS